MYIIILILFMLTYFCNLFLTIGQWHIKDVMPTAEGESQKVKLKVRVNINGLITVASASLVEKKQDGSQSENIEMENGTESAQSQEATMDTSGGSQEQQQQQQNGPEAQEVRDEVMKGEPQQKQSWTQKVGQWFSGVRVGIACSRPILRCLLSMGSLNGLKLNSETFSQQTPQICTLPRPRYEAPFAQKFILTPSEEWFLFCVVFFY